MCPSDRPLRIGCETLERRRLLTTYFVDNLSPAATANGSIDTPWKTVAQVEAFTGYKAGDVVRFARGRVWREQLDVPASDLKFSSYSPIDGATANPLISGADVVGGPSATNGQTNAWYQDTADPTLYWSKPAAAPAVVLRNQAGTRTWLEPSKNAYAGLTESTPWYYDASLRRLYLKTAADPDTVAGLKIEVGQRDRSVHTNSRSNVIVECLDLGQSNSSAVFVTGGTGNTVRYCNLSFSNSADVNGVKFGGAGVFLNFTTNATVDSNTVTGMRGDGVYGQSVPGVRITNNVIDTVFQGVNTGGDNIQLGGRNELGLDQNHGYLISGNMLTQQGTDTPKGNIIAELGDYGVVRDNVCAYDNFGVAVAGNHLLVERNTMHDQNTANNTGTSGTGAAMQVGGDSDNGDYTDLTFRYNVVYGSVVGVNMTGINFTRSDAKILNNTIYDVTGRGINITVPFSGQIRNNVIDSTRTSYQNALRVLSFAGATSSAANNHFGHTKAGYLQWGGGTYSSAAAFAGATGFSRLFDGDPRFASTSPTASDFLRLASGSPVIDQGTSEFYVAGQRDRDGTSARNGAGVDFGAYER